MSVGLLAVLMWYRPYIRIHLSKWFTFSLEIAFVSVQCGVVLYA